MTEPKFTLAPWQVFENQYGIYVRIPNGEVIAQMVGDFNSEDKRKHANLIAASGDLLESLVDCLYFYERHSNRWDGVNGKHPHEVVEAARAAIAKATGES